MIEAFKQLRQIHKIFALAAERLEEDIGKPVCISSCGICCQHNTPRWMTIEAINAVSVLTGLGRLSKALSIAEGWLLEQNQEAMTYEGMPVGWASPRVRDEFNALAVSQCPFLEQDMRCGIYEVRPLTCRAFGVTRDNADTCLRPPGKGETITQRRYIHTPVFRQMVEDFRKRCGEKNQTWVHAGFVPTLLFRAGKEKKFRDLVKDNAIASAKIVGVDYETTLMWQPQVDAIRRGVMPELALAEK
jgi:Fe-S-cluster containining protein